MLIKHKVNRGHQERLSYVVNSVKFVFKTRMSWFMNGRISNKIYLDKKSNIISIITLSDLYFSSH